jgi:hypothetical protein
MQLRHSLYQAGRFLLRIGKNPVAGRPGTSTREVSGRENLAMARYEFRFIVTDADLSEGQQRKVSQAIAEAGTLAVAAETPREAVTVVGESRLLGPGVPWIWRGIPPVTLTEGLQAYATEKVYEVSGQ